MPTKRLKFEFKREKAIEAIIYIALKISDPTFLRISKLVYFADKTSLEKYGRFICGDNYVGMKFGPVPSNLYNLMREAPDDGEFGFRRETQRNIVTCRNPHLDEFSDSDMECLDLAVKIWGNAPVWKLIQDSHDEAYNEAWNKRGSRSSVKIPIEGIVSLLDDSEQLLEHLRTQHDE